ncbi:MAG: RdgB/HAM1 family non-canonical purine NTP pyrophosphatase [Spirochaetales bacterium]|nr:RdgB/HAM1 family non-canonical purine NTP pyrophosphatase [Spirochaetales bacterium]
MDTIILATKNRHKTRELSEIFGGSILLKDLTSIDFNKEIIEDGNSFIENAIIKCRTVYETVGLPVLADDSGLCVEAMGGKPGIHTARYGGEGLTDVQRYELMLREMKGQTNRNAAYICALVLYISPTRFYIVQEDCRGTLLESPVGTGGFGYDPIFFTPVYGKGMAEISEEEKNAISHRGKAALAMKNLILNLNIHKANNYGKKL